MGGGDEAAKQRRCTTSVLEGYDEELVGPRMLLPVITSGRVERLDLGRAFLPAVAATRGSVSEAKERSWNTPYTFYSRSIIVDDEDIDRGKAVGQATIG